MKAVLCLLLLVCTPPLLASDWLRWHNVGRATLSWGPFTLYDSQLLTPDGRWQPQRWPLALVITYRRDITRQSLLEATQEQWQAQQIGSAPQRQRWLQQLSTLWPDVSNGDRLAFQADERGGQFFWQPAGTRTPIEPLEPRFDAAFRDAFLAIWLSEKTQYPDLRQQLTGDQ